MRRVFLDHQSSTPVLPEVLAAMLPWFSEHFGVPSSLHQHGLRARDAVGKAREQMAAFIHAAAPEEIIFTSDGTESVNLAIKGAAYAQRRHGTHIIVSATEHPAVMQSLEFLAGEGFTHTKVPVNGEGLVEPEAVRAALTEQTILIAVHHVNHDIGAIQPIVDIGKIAAERGITFFVDAEASAGWLPIDVQAMGASLVAFSAHKFYGPKGAGVLYRNRRTRLTSLLHGGIQEEGRRAGTENVPAIVGAGLAAEFAGRELAARATHTGTLQRMLWEHLDLGVPYVRLNGPMPGPQRVSTNLNFSVEFVEGEGVMLLLDTQGIAAASGAACVSKSLKVPPVLRAIGLDPALAQGNILLSLGKDNTAEEMHYVTETIVKIAAKLRGMSPAWDEFQRGQIDSVIAPRGAAQT